MTCSRSPILRYVCFTYWRLCLSGKSLFSNNALQYVCRRDGRHFHPRTQLFTGRSICFPIMRSTCDATDQRASVSAYGSKEQKIALRAEHSVHLRFIKKLPNRRNRTGIALRGARDAPFSYRPLLVNHWNSCEPVHEITKTLRQTSSERLPVQRKV
jgi:hypothetical protein